MSNEEDYLMTDHETLPMYIVNDCIDNDTSVVGAYQKITEEMREALREFVNMYENGTDGSGFNCPITRLAYHEKVTELLKKVPE